MALALCWIAALMGTNIIMFLALVSRWLVGSSIFQRAQKPLLRLDSSNEFHIAIFSDLHYGEEENGWGIDQDVGSTRVMTKVLEAEKLDFVVINGDLITGENTFLSNSTKYLDIVVKPLIDHNMSWSSTYGNHDSQFNLSREGLFQEESKFIASYTQHSPAGVSGITNYYLPIFPPDEDSPVAILWFFDSQGGAPFQAKSNSQKIPSWVGQSVITWFKSEQASIKSKWGQLPSLAFVHIPPTAFLKVQKSTLSTNGKESAIFPGLNGDVPLAIQGDGWQDVPFMQALVDTPGLHSIYSGHDHGDAWCANWPNDANSTKGVSKPHICFCKHTGYGGYGTWNRGSRILRLSFGKEMEIESWIRMENGEIVQKIGLNETYGKDVYPKEDGQSY